MLFMNRPWYFAGTELDGKDWIVFPWEAVNLDEHDEHVQRQHDEIQKKALAIEEEMKKPKAPIIEEDDSYTPE